MSTQIFRTGPSQHPTTIPGTRRQQMTSRKGEALSRQYVYMSEESWETLQRLCIAQQRSGSQVIASLINIAAAAQVGTRNDSKTNRTN